MPPPPPNRTAPKLNVDVILDVPLPTSKGRGPPPPRPKPKTSVSEEAACEAEGSAEVVAVPAPKARVPPPPPKKTESTTGPSGDAAANSSKNAPDTNTSPKARLPPPPPKIKSTAEVAAIVPAGPPSRPVRPPDAAISAKVESVVEPASIPMDVALRNSTGGTPPSRPSAPAKPAAPTKPMAPAKPAAPTKPMAPEKPAAPTKPMAPEKPAAPTKPMAPAKPAAPTKPMAKPTPPPKREAPALPPRPTKGHPLYHYMVSGPQCIGTFAFKSDTTGDLNFDEGDIIRLKRWVNAEWLEGELDGSTGQFPVAFVDITEEIPVTGPRGIAIADFEPAHEFELGLGSGEEVAILGLITGGEWYRGCVHGQEGLFPASFIEVIEELPTKAFEEWPAGYLEAQTALSNTGGSAAQGSVGDSEHFPGSANVIANFPADQDGDLALAMGDLVTDIQDAGDGWFRGKSGGREGIFPRDFVQFTDTPSSSSDARHDDNDSDAVVSYSSISAEPATSSALGTTASASSAGTAVAIADFTAENEGDLALLTGDTVHLLEYIGNDWIRGKMDGPGAFDDPREGIFPRAFVEITKELDVSTAPKFTTAPAKTGRAEVIADFSAAQEGDLALCTGDKVVLLERVDDDWLKGECNGKSGIFPRNFVNIIEEL